MANLDKITRYIKDNHIQLENLTPTMVHNMLSENESITINEWKNLGPEELKTLDKLDDGRYNPILKRGDKAMVIRFNPSEYGRGDKGVSLGHYGWVDSMEARKALDFVELEVITDHSDHRTKPIPEYGPGWSKETLEWQSKQKPTINNTYVLYAKVMVTDPENKYYKAEFRLDPENFTWVKVEDDIDKEIYHDIDLDEDLVNWSYDGDEIGVIKETLEEKNKDNIDRMKGENIVKVGAIPTSKRLAAEVIDRVLKSHKYGPYAPGNTINLEQETLNGPEGYDFENRLRFDILRESLMLDKEGRGFSFEGIMAGFFGGQPAQAGLKEDIYIDGVPVSVKQSNAIMNGTADAWDTGSLLGKELSGEINSGYNLVKKQIEDAGLEVPTELDETTGETKYGGKVKKNLSAFETPYALLVAGQEYDVYKRRMLETVFTSSKGVPLYWIFAGITENGNVKYRYMSSEQLIDNILNVSNIHEVIGLGRNRENGFRIKSKPILTQEATSAIILPQITEKELIEATYEKEGTKLIDRIANLFGDKASRVNRKVINYIKDNPSAFLERLKVLMPELEELTRKERPSENDFKEATKRVNMLIIEAIKDSINFREKKMRDRVHWWWDNEGFTLDQDILKVMGVGPNDYYDVRREALAYLGGLEGLSEKIYDDLTVGMEQINYGDHTIKYTIDDIEFYMTPGGLAHADVEISVDPDGKLDIMGMDDNVHTYTLEDLSWYPAPEDETKVSDESADEIYEELQDSILVALSDKYFNKYGIELGGIHVALGKEDFHDHGPTSMNVNNRYTDKSYQLREDSDIFGQGLRDPIEPEEFEGDEEEWEKMMSDVEDDSTKGGTLEPGYEYTGGKTDPEKGFVAPSAEVTTNICRVKGFCSEQGPITFGQLRELVEEATKKRFGSDIARGGFKTIWRLVPWFIPQLLLVAAGVTVTRAINKIITPALTDTKGYKSWWGKAVLKAMDIAEGDYIPDKALGDDPLSKIFFISDGLLNMLKDKYKLKFARYVSAVAQSKPDDEIVPQWFVDDLLRDYLNQKFLLDPPLQTRAEFKKNHIIEGYSSTEGNMLNTMSDLYNTEYLYLNEYDLDDIITSVKFKEIELRGDKGLYVMLDIYTDIENFDNFNSEWIEGWDEITKEFGEEFSYDLKREFSEHIIYNIFGIKSTPNLGIKSSYERISPTIWTKGNKPDNIIKESNIDAPKQNPEVDAGDTIMFTYIHPNFKEMDGIQTMEPYVVEEESIMMKDKYTTSNIEKFIEHVRFIVKKERHPNSARYAIGSYEISRLSYFRPDGTSPQWVNPLYLRWIKLDDETAQRLMESPKERSLQSTLLETLKDEFIRTITPATKEMMAFCYGWDEYLPEKYQSFEKWKFDFICEEVDNTIYNLAVEIENWLFKFGVNVRELDTVNEEMRQWYANIYNGIDNRLTSNELGIPTPIDSDNQHLIYNNDVKEPAWNRKVTIKEDDNPNKNSLLSKIITENKYELLKIVVNDIGWDGITRLEPTIEEFKDILRNFLKIYDIKTQGVIWLTLRWNTTQAGQEFNDSIIETLKNVDYKDLQVPPTFWDIDVYYTGYVEDDEQEEFCDDDGYGNETGDECECERWETIVVEDEDGLEDSAPCDEAEDYFTQKQLDSIFFDEDECQCEDYYSQWYVQKLQNTDTANFLATELDNVPNLETTKTTHFMDDEFEYSEASEKGYWELSRDVHHDTDYWDEYDGLDEGEITEIYTSEFHLTGPSGLFGKSKSIKESPTRLRPKWVIMESNGAYPFDRKDIAIMKMIHNEFDIENIRKLSNVTTEYGFPKGVQQTYMNILKIFGYGKESDGTHDPETQKMHARFAMWVADNWNEEGDYENLEDPVKRELEWYRGTLNTSGDQVEYRSGEIDVLGWDEEDATDEISDNFYDWGGEQETYDWGDYNEYDSEVEDVHLIDESAKRILEKKIKGNEEMVVGDRVMVVNMDDPWGITPYTSGTVTEVQPNDPATSPHMNGQDTKTSYMVAWDVQDGRTMKLLGGIDRWMKIDSDALENINENFVIDKDAGLSPDLKAGDDIIIVRNTTGVDIPLYTEFEVLKQKRDTTDYRTESGFNVDMLYIADSTRYPSGGRGSTFLALTKNDDPNNYEHKDRFRRDKISWLKITKDDTVLTESTAIGPSGDSGYWAVNLDNVQTVVDRVYPKIVDKLGPSLYFDEKPPIELWKDIYARLSGIEEMTGEESESSKAQFDDIENKIYVYYPNMVSEEEVIRSLLHEYTHHLQDPEKWEEYRAEGYDNNPYEIAAFEAEENWKDYLQSKKKSTSPELEVGDEILMVRDGHPSFQARPKKYIPYKVIEVIKGDVTYNPDTGKSEMVDNEDNYYELHPVNLEDDKNVHTGRPNESHMYKGDEWVVNPGTKSELNEHEESRLSPELEVGDNIIVIDIDEDVESNIVKYNVPSLSYRPERYVPYTVVEKKTTGGKSKWPFNYILIETDKYQDYLSGDYMISTDSAKLLFPWIYKWISMDTPMATNVDRKTISEHKESRLNPKLKVGDEIMVVKVGDVAPNKQTIPDTYVRYFVTKIYHGDEWHTYPYSQTYYGLNRPDIDVTDPERPGVYDQSSIHKYLFPETDKWIFNPEAPTMDYKDAFQPHKTFMGRFNEHKESRLNPQLMIGDEILVVSTKGIHDFGSPKLYEPYVVVGIKHGSTINREIHKWTHGEEDEEDRWDSPEVPRSRLGFKKEFDTIPYTYYQIEPIGMTDEERTGAMLAGGGRMKPMYIFPSPSEYRGSDQWILRPGFIRGANEAGELYEDDGYVNDMVYIDEPREKHIKKMSKGLGKFENFPIQDFMNTPPPPNESDTTEDEIEHIESIPVDKEFVDTTDDIDQHFKIFLNEKGLEWPQEDIDNIMKGVKNIILRLKYHYNRPRPGQIADEKDIELNPTTLDSASTPSYPSGHATQGRVIGKYLADLYPEYEKELLKLGHDVGHGRLMAKVHYPSDQSFGIELGDALYEYIDNHEIELDEYCPMGNPNKCEIVDYDTLPDMIHESVPQPGSSSAEGFDDKDLPYETEYLTLDQILNRVENIAYYREVLRDLQDDKDDWEVTQTVKRYADYWMENPESLTGPDFPPIQVIGKGMKDGSHRISTLNALANYIDVDNPYWKDVKLEVRFYDPETVMASGHYYPWLWDISDEDLQQAIDDKVYNWEVLEKWLADPNAKSDLEKLRAESFSNHKNKQLNEHQETRLNPELEVGDIIKVISVDGEHARMPELFADYKVVKTRDATMDPLTHEYYDIVPYPEVELSDVLSLSDTLKIPARKTLYRGDKWIRSWKEEIPKYMQEHKEATLNPELEVGDEIIVVHRKKNNFNFDITWPELYKPYVVVKITHPNKYQPSNAQTFYELIPANVEGIDYSFKKGEMTVTGIDLRGPGVKRMYPTDKWLFNTGFLNEQKSFMDNSDQAMERARKEALRRGLLNSLDMLFDVLPYEEGEIVHNDVNMGVYEKETGQFVPIDYVYDPIMENMGMQVSDADLQLFIDIITDWVNIRMSSHNIEEYVN